MVYATVEIRRHRDAAPGTVDLRAAPSAIFVACPGARGHRAEVVERIDRSRLRRRRNCGKPQTKIKPSSMIRLPRLVTEPQTCGGVHSERAHESLGINGGDVDIAVSIGHGRHEIERQSFASPFCPALAVHLLDSNMAGDKCTLQQHSFEVPKHRPIKQARPQPLEQCRIDGDNMARTDTVIRSL